MSMRGKLKEVAVMAEEIIKKFLNGDKEIDLCGLSSTPILQECSYDGNLTYTLDYIQCDDKGISFRGSNACDCNWWYIDELSTDILVDIAEFLEELSEDDL